MTTGRAAQPSFHAPRRRRLSAAAAVVAVLVALVGDVGGCEVIIGHNLPDFACTPGGTDVCPGSQVCSPYGNQCVAPCETTGCANGTTCDTTSHFCVPIDASTEADVPGDDDSGDAWGSDSEDAMNDDETLPPVEAGGDGDGGGSNTPDAPPACNGIGCKCGGPADCATGLCSDQESLTSGLYAQEGNINFCTRSCCTSSDCPGNSVCYATAAGGNYCVLPAWLGRSQSLGTAGGGAPCASGNQCRSGLCAMGACADTCCSTAGSSTECSGGTVCRFSAFPGTKKPDQNTAPNCGPSPGSMVNGASCGNNSDCRSNLCLSESSLGTTLVCHDACRGPSDCGGGQACSYQVDNGGNVLSMCVMPNGNLTEGQSCSPTSDMCATGFCGSNAMECTDVCFADSDCTKHGWRCRPEQLRVYVMGQAGGNYSVLACGS